MRFRVRPLLGYWLLEILSVESEYLQHRINPGSRVGASIKQARFLVKERAIEAGRFKSAQEAVDVVVEYTRFVKVLSLEVGWVGYEIPFPAF